MPTKNSLRRNRLIQLIHVARRELAMDKETYVLMVQGLPGLEGVTSSAQLTIPQMEVVLEQLKKRGFRVRPKRQAQQDRPLADDAQSRKIRHLWLELHAMGAVRDPSEHALSKFVCAMVKIEALQWLSTSQASQVIEHLKKWQQRVGKAQRMAERKEKELKI